ncbi:ABC transporter permease [Acidihalobacter ferrooxydans]|uniref:ABC transporter permease n=1 Tax=Acidihalobacter ferrooxydans TaxID=1765967 RepID=A0A1P8ULC7_9GAMM|nr:ABC transporter permease [Acidihalobacter ferrooxydans]
MARIRTAQFGDHLVAWLLITPALVLLVAFTLYPAAATLWQSFFSTPLVNRPAHFVGFAHFQQMLADPVFVKVLVNNLLYAAGSIPASVALALLMALLVNARIPGRGLARMAFFTPTVLPLIAAANIWLFFYTPGYGLLDQLLHVFGLAGHNWLGNPSTALWAVTAVTVWKQAGFFMIFYLAALQQIPENLREAAAIEGASRWHTLRRVILPLLGPTTLFVLVNAVIGAFSQVDALFVLTNGGPDNASNLLLYYIFQNAFQFWDTGYAAALTVVLVLILAAASLVQFLFVGRRTHYR